jgi:site-specific DNA-methyltransferase (cytosine-N4-specific)
VIREGFTSDHGGAIPPNLLAISNTGNDPDYIAGCKEKGLRAHPARFPAEIPEFFINFLTTKDDLVIDPFAGSNVTGAVAETMGRRWLATDIDEEYVKGSEVRFENLQYSLVDG